MAYASTDRLAILDALLPIAQAAGRQILEIYRDEFDVRRKADDSPVTAADERAEALILEGLERLSPRRPIVSEEAHAAGVVPDIGASFWLVDPLDGTREFINRNGEFTVNIALIEHGSPVIGVVYAPAVGRLYYGCEDAGAYLIERGQMRRIRCRRQPREGVTVVSSRSHGDAAALERYLSGRAVVASRQAGSSLKFCLLAAGEADLYPRFGRTMEWDTAAGHAVLAAAGGRVDTLDGAELHYGKPGFENPHFIAMGLP
jgi:3'(2'), 5'-bisphosphate nucleotidase